MGCAWFRQGLQVQVMLGVRQVKGPARGGRGGLWDRDHVASLAVAGSFAGGWSRCYPSFQISKRSQQFRS